ncbi:MAG: A/G-specific adenine glycosylase [Calditrichaeota bacterium]|nr:A/G-specific adenine glycosylase [Calditrichota bacterium]
MTNQQRAQFRRRLLQWYKKNRRLLPWRKTSDFYSIWVSEVMLQQTQVVKVIDYYQRFLEQFPNVKTLAEAELEKTLRLWQGLGYYARARNLHRAAQILLDEYDGRAPNSVSDFKKLPGVGEYIAAAVYSLAKGTPLPAIDGNVKRVFARIFEIAEPMTNSAGERAVNQAVRLVFDDRCPGEFNQAMIELGALICKPRNPRCDDCPLSPFCASFANSTQQDFPRKKNKNPIPERRLAVGVILNEGKFLLVRRNPFGLLGGFWEFPGGKIEAAETAADACARQIQAKCGIAVTVGENIGVVKHSYSHFKIVVQIFLCQPVVAKLVLRDHDDFVWVNFVESRELPIHGAHLKIIEILKKEELK